MTARVGSGDQTNPPIKAAPEAGLSLFYLSWEPRFDPNHCRNGMDQSFTIINAPPVARFIHGPTARGRLP